MENYIPGVNKNETTRQLKIPEEKYSQENVEFLIENMQNMSLTKENQSDSIGVVNPFIQYGYTEDKLRFIQIDVLIMTLPKAMFRP